MSVTPGGRPTIATAVACMICERTAFRPTALVADLPALLQRWASHVGAPPPPALSAECAQSGEVRLWQCDGCGFGAFLPPRPGSNAFYEFISEHDYYFESRWDFRQAIHGIRRHGARSLLDVGCGNGAFLSQARQRLPALATIGYDANEQLAAVVTAGGHAFVGGDLNTIAAGSLDAVSLLQVLEHVADPLALLERCRELLGRNGLLIVSVPDAGALIRYQHDALTEFPPHHVTRWTESALRTALERVGMSPRLVAHQPLERYLWDSYLESALAEGAWFGEMLAPLVARYTGFERVEQIRRLLEAAGIRELWGVHGHTLLMMAQPR